MITRYLPTFKYMEVNNLTGLRTGQVLAQFKANEAITTVSKGEYKFIENGLIVGLGSDGTIENYDAKKHAQPFVHFTEELNTFLDELNRFAVEVVDGVAYPRAIGLYVGDTFTTNNYTGTYEGAKAAKVGTTGVLELQAEVDNDSLFIATPTTMPNGDEGVEFTCFRLAPVAGE